jgi:hypothetical protein
MEHPLLARSRRIPRAANKPVFDNKFGHFSLPDRHVCNMLFRTVKDRGGLFIYG